MAGWLSTSNYGEIKDSEVILWIDEYFILDQKFNLQKLKHGFDGTELIQGYF